VRNEWNKEGCKERKIEESKRKVENEGERGRRRGR